MPAARGVKTLNTVHFTDFVSFQIVKSVVEQGKWNIENIQVHTAVTEVQPFRTSISLRSVSEE